MAIGDPAIAIRVAQRLKSREILLGQKPLVLMKTIMKTRISKFPVAVAHNSLMEKFLPFE
ncbi:hypothetical protein PMA3_21985 [Pseudomonas silesiensis]|uniref:Uncharacterized protein n=1 Tax=Pseudomonas silesiensis TaxID=1853130 RepID=A0A191YY68_9PSED|nr:hypothetical protein PMA3_21985 [Pseudomonas silesiensis]